MARSHILKGFSDLESALWLHKFHSGLTISQMVKVAVENGYEVTDTVNYEISQLLHEWGLANKQTRSLTPKGEAFYALWRTKRDVAIEVLHGLQYTLWTVNQPEQNLASWAYKIITDALWEWNALPSDMDTLAVLVEQMRQKQEHIIPPEVGATFSVKSVNNAFDWLFPLKPPVLHGVSVTAAGRKSFKNARFARRQSCSTVLFVMAVAYVARESGPPFQIDDERRRTICRLCLIEEAAFDPMAAKAIEEAPNSWNCEDFSN